MRLEFAVKKKHVKALVLWKLFKHVLLNFFLRRKLHKLSCGNTKKKQPKTSKAELHVFQTEKFEKMKK